jgi:hypothetical protein
MRLTGIALAIVPLGLVVATTAMAQNPDWRGGAGSGTFAACKSGIEI